MNPTPPNPNDHFKPTFLFLCAGGLLTFIYIFAITFCTIPAKNERLVDIILGVLLGATITGAYNWLTASTAGSSAKNAVIAGQQASIKEALAATPPPTAPEPAKQDAAPTPDA